MAETHDCPFCNSGKRVIQQNDLAQVVLSDPHKVPGHLLVLPKRHVEKPWELTHAEITDIFDLIFALEKKLLGKLGDGFNIRQNYLPFKDQGLKVDHVVFHVLPRSEGDFIYQISEQYEQDLFADLDDMERDAVIALLKEK